MGIHPQARQKAEQRAVDMSPLEEELAAATVWKRPDKDELLEEEITTALGDRSQSEIQLKMRTVTSVVSYEMVGFALILQVRQGSRWVTVIEVDTSHDVDCHCHQHGKSAGGRIGDPIQLTLIGCADDVQDAYHQGYQHLDEGCEMFVERWRRG